MQKIKILFTGGHALATAFALISYIKKSDKNWNLYWVGPESHVEGKDVKSLENEIFKRMDVGIFNITAGRLQRKFTRWTVISLLKIPVGIIQSFVVLLKVRPNAVLSFGGYVGFPVVLSAYILRIPVILHEQTIAAGRANIYSSFFAKKIALARENSRKYFPKSKTVVTGNPIDEKIFQVKEKIGTSSPTTLFVTGGHTGSVLVNKTIMKLIPELLEKFNIVHQTGQLDFENVDKYKESLEPRLRKKYKVVATISSQLWPENIGKADIIISRAGANVVSQIMVAKRPAILIPIPWSVFNEQMENAEYARRFGIAAIIEEKDLSPERLKLEIYDMVAKYPQIINAVKNKKSPDMGASERLVKIIDAILS